VGRGRHEEAVVGLQHQGLRRWGQRGHVPRGPVADDRDYDRQSSSVSSDRGHRTVSRQLHRERILDVADLAALPKGRTVVLASGSRPTLIRTQPWMTGRYADAIRSSIATHGPAALVHRTAPVIATRIARVTEDES
jgi:hypothetical protein